MHKTIYSQKILVVEERELYVDSVKNTGPNLKNRRRHAIDKI